MSKSTDKGRPIFGLHKIPESELLKFANIEIGKLNAYIGKLLHERSQLKKELFQWRRMSEAEKSQAQTTYYTDNVLEKQRKQQIADLELSLKKLKREYDVLFHKYCLLKNDIVV